MICLSVRVGPEEPPYPLDKDLKEKSMAIWATYIRHGDHQDPEPLSDQITGTEDYMQDSKPEQCHDLKDLELCHV